MNGTIIRRSLSLLATGAMLLVFVATASQAQVSAASESAAQPLAQVQQHAFVAVTADQMAQEDAQRTAAGLPYRFALPVDVALTPDNAGTWESLPDGRSLWRLRLASPGVLSLNLGFVRLDLPVGAQFLVYPADNPAAARRLDTDVNAAHGQLWTPVFLTDELVVELVVPASERALVTLELSRIGRGYRFFGEQTDDKSGSCNVDVVCADGDDWRNEIDTVGLVQRDGTELCTGFMINNTASDGRPLFMTAFHCFVDEDSAPTLVVYWNFQRASCGGSAGGDLSQFSSGSTLKAAYVTSDFTLVELDQVPDPSFGVKYAGWNRANTDPPTAVCIHHPSTDEKAISFEYNALTTTTYLSDGPSPGNGTHLRVADWDVGTTEGGSSGSPLFDENHRVVGQLHGGRAACGNHLPDWYGRFSVSWVGGGTASTGLQDHLDAGNTGATTVNLLNPRAASFLVTQIGDGTSTGIVGGPFEPFAHTFNVANNGTKSVDFTVATTVTWLDLDTAGGTLGVGQQMAVTATLAASATALPQGVHHAEIVFDNPSGGGGATTREVILTVTQNSITLLNPAPNPFSNTPVSIRYTLSGEASVSAEITNIRGFKIRSLGQFAGTTGENAIPWDGLDDHGHRAPSGVYVVTVQALGRTVRTNVVYTH